MQNALVPAAVVVVLTLLVWLRREPTKPLLRSRDARSVAELNRTQLSLVIEAADAPEAGATDASGEEQSFADAAGKSWLPPQTAQDRLALQNHLRLAMAGGPDDRLEAVRIASRWGGEATLPLLRRALRDSDGRVVEAAAAAMAPRRGAPRPQAVQTSRPPRNVARMR